MCIVTADSCCCTAETNQHCKAIILQLKTKSLIGCCAHPPLKADTIISCLLTKPQTGAVHSPGASLCRHHTECLLPRGPCSPVFYRIPCSFLNQLKTTLKDHSNIRAPAESAETITETALQLSLSLCPILLPFLPHKHWPWGHSPTNFLHINHFRVCLQVNTN